jgi:hypothetical protein
MDLMTAKEAAELWDVTARQVQLLCVKGQIAGAERLGKIWVIPKGTAKPLDGRTKAAKLQKQMPKPPCVLDAGWETEGKSE